MAGPSINWDQYPTDTQGGTNIWDTTPGGTYSPYGGPGIPIPDTRTMDPSQAIPNTGIAGGATMTDQNGSFAGGGRFTPINDSPGVHIDPTTGQPVATTASNPMARTGQDPQAFFNQLFPGQSLSPQDLAAHEAELNAQGIKIIRNAAGQPSKIQLPDGSVVDPIIGAGSGQNTKAWNVVAGPGGAPMGGGVNGSAGSVLGGMGYNFGSSMAPIGLFTPPTAEDAMNSPGLQFALSEANRMGQNSAAAKGTLLNGRFQQALNASNIQNALQGYGDVYNRAANTYGINYQTQTGNQDRPFNKNLSLAELGKPA